MRVSDDLRIGTELAGYRIDSMLGRGGMSVVYLAEDRRLRRRVALKLLAAGLAEDESFRQRFLRESELAASIDHPNIVPIYEAGEGDGLLFIAMRYVEGRDLRARLQRGPLELAAATGIVAQLASALDAAHARGLVHRDVKPSNVLLDVGARPDGSDHAYLADFGITQSIAEPGAVGEGGRLMGTIDYVAPEQISGDEVDGRADVYALGCVLYECLVGEPPFRRDSDMAVVFAHLEAEPPAPSAQRRELPAALDGVIATALAKEPEHRFAGCRELAAATLAVAADEASRLLAAAAARTAAGRSELNEVEAELAGTVIDLRSVREQARTLATTPAAARPGAESICPFKGLASFEPGDAELFFGRERLLAELVASLAGAGLLGVVGPSGSGKSSLLAAGLLPTLAADGLPGSAGWRRLLMRPGERPLDALRAALESEAVDPVTEALDALPAGARLLLVVDQLEELFTSCRSDAERAAFADLLARAAADPDGRAILVLALRADYYGRIAAYPALAELLGANHVLVGPMQASDLRRVVELPAGRAGLQVEPELTDALIGDVEGEPGALPLLSTALLELWQKREGRALTLAAYHDSGRVHGAVARLAETTYERIPEDRRPLVRAIMLRLVGDGEADAPVRRRAALAELDLERNPDVADVLATLADHRLVTVGDGSVEVAHEALLREWPRLREWIEEDADGRRLHRHLGQAAAEWAAAGRDQAELYRGARLAAALDWSADHAADLNEVEREFVSESRAASERETTRARRTNRRLRALLAGVAVLLVVAAAGGLLALVQRGEARDAETAQLAQRLGAQALVEEDLDRALLLARQAVAIDDSPQTRSSLLAALMRAPKSVGIMHGSDDALFWSAALSPDGSTLAVADFFGRILFFDARTFEPVGDPLVTGWVQSVAYSPDGSTLALGGQGWISLVDVRARADIAQAEVPGWAARLHFTHDGGQLVALVERSIHILDATTLQAAGEPIELEGFRGAYIQSYSRYPHVALTPDGRALITASDAGELAWWDLESRRKTRALPIAEGYHALAISPDGRNVAVGIDGGIQLVDVRTGQTTSVRAGLTGSPNSVAFSPDGQTVVTASEDGTVTLWDAGAAAVRETLRGHSNDATAPVFSLDGETLYTVSADGTGVAWDVEGTRSLERSFRFTHDRDFDGAFDNHPGRFSPDGRLIAVGLKEEGVALLNASDLTPAGAPLVDTGGEVKAISFSPDGRTLAAMTTTGRVTVWDVQTRALRYQPALAGGASVGLGFSPDGRILAATGGWNGMELLDAASGAELGLLGPQAGTSDVSFSADGVLVAFAVPAGTPRAEVWDLASRSSLAVVEGVGSGDSVSVALSPDGRLLAVGGYGNVVGIWEVATGRLRRALDHGGAGALTLDFSADGRILAVSGYEPVASLWDVETGTPHRPGLHAGRRAAMADLSADGKHLLMTLANGEGAVWDIDPDSWAQRACTVANRTLTREEWDAFLPGRPYDPACR